MSANKDPAIKAAVKHRDSDAWSTWPRLTQAIILAAESASTIGKMTWGLEGTAEVAIMET